MARRPGKSSKVSSTPKRTKGGGATERTQRADPLGKASGKAQAKPGRFPGGASRGSKAGRATKKAWQDTPPEQVTAARLRDRARPAPEAVRPAAPAAPVRPAPGAPAPRALLAARTPPSAPTPAAVAGDPLLSALSRLPTGATATQLAQALKRPEDARELSTDLRRLVERGQVLEVRPGRYQIAGTGGEYPVMIQAAASAPPIPPEALPQVPPAPRAELPRPDEIAVSARRKLQARRPAPLASTMPVGAAPAGGALQARLPDGRILPVNPAYHLGVRAGDIAQAVVGEDGQALITKILRRGGREVAGIVQFRPGGNVLVPDNRKEGQLPILGAFPKFHDLYHAGDRVVGAVTVDARGQAGVTLTRILGKETPEVADFRDVCLAHDLPGPFPPEVEAAAQAFPDRFPLGAREDLRNDLVFTIDPATAKDFDDAISLAPGPDGGSILGVHIADVSHYVRAGETIDQEAVRRGTSIYLINRVIPMLPEALSNGLCSLVPERDRYCLSAFLTLDRNGSLVSTRIAETLIRSRHRLTYEEALEVLEDRDPAGRWPVDLRRVLVQVGDIAQRLRRAREKAGALNLFAVEHRFALDVEGLPVEVSRETSDIAHQLIEECMLLANRAVAQWLEMKGLPCVYRIHQEPDPERLKSFATVLASYGKDSHGLNDRFALQKLLGELGQEPPAARLVLNGQCLRAFRKAVYGIENIGHYALAFRSYAHFTSPIRRYPDLLVHRLCKRGLGLPGYENVEIRRNYLDALAKQASWLEQRAEDAERDLHARKSTRYLAKRLGEEFPGVVMSANPGGLTVQLLETGMEGFLPMRELKDDFYVFDPERLALVGRDSGRVLAIGLELDVCIAAADVEKNDVILALAGMADSFTGRPGRDFGGGRQRRGDRKERRDEGRRGRDRRR
jgi:ribonuclease R